MKPSSLFPSEQTQQLPAPLKLLHGAQDFPVEPSPRLLQAQRKMEKDRVG
jgi:hypothetical protein